MDKHDSTEIVIASQIKSKKRVSDHGEVFTAEREVKAMCDLVKDECDRIESRFLEPACGSGNFLRKSCRENLKLQKKFMEKARTIFRNTLSWP